MGLDCLLVHVPKFNSAYKPFGEMMFINLLPMGLLAMADLLDREGHSCRVKHLGVEWIEDRAFRIEEALAQAPPRVVGMPLHWHHQSYDVIETARRIKARCPDTFVVLGGYTASYFHQEILREFPFVDAVIKGDGEIPLLRLMEARKAGGTEYSEVPNLTWRNGEKVVSNPFGYVATTADMEKLCFTNFDLLDHHDVYVQEMGLPYVYLKGLSKKGNRALIRKTTRMLLMEVGRGCPTQCTWCGGGSEGHKMLFGRKKIVFRSQDSVMRSIYDAKKYGFDTLGIFFDPTPPRPQYYLDLFARIRAEKLDFHCYFECWGLPHPDLVEAFHQTFPSPESVMSISPESWSERVRKANKGYFYTNEQLLEALAHMDRLRVGIDLFFAVGVPGETEDDFMETVAAMHDLRKRFKSIQELMLFTIEMEPASPLHENPERFGIVTVRRTFMDYYRSHEGKSRPLTALGYALPGFF
ncbi:MAG: radical SAM protein, partial [Armatimonadetes bacterium]|nr:radical SAM protein [Armatimonadota bacterium]